MVTMYALAAEYRSLLDAADETPEALDVAVQQLTGELADKAEAVAKVIAMLEGEAKAFGDEAARLTGHAKSRERRAAWLRNYLKRCLEAAGARQIKGPLFTIAIQDNPPRVEANELEVDASFKRAYLDLPLSDVPEALLGIAHVSVDLAAIKEYQKRTGEMPAGTRLQQGTHLRIR